MRTYLVFYHGKNQLTTAGIFLLTPIFNQDRDFQTLWRAGPPKTFLEDLKFLKNAFLQIFLRAKVKCGNR